MKSPGREKRNLKNREITDTMNRENKVWSKDRKLIWLCAEKSNEDYENESRKWLDWYQWGIHRGEDQINFGRPDEDSCSVMRGKSLKNYGKG